MNKTITGIEAFELLKDADALIINDSNEAVVYGTPQKDEGGCLLSLGYEDGNGQTHDFLFMWEEQDSISIVDDCIMLPEFDGQDTVGIKILQVKDITGRNAHVGKWVIRNVSDDDYWAEETGWVDLEQANTFTDQEQENSTAPLPEGGVWVKITSHK